VSDFAAYHPPVERNRSRLGYWRWLAVIILVVVIGYGLLYAYREFLTPPSARSGGTIASLVGSCRSHVLEHEAIRNSIGV
jgi:hypothetical protein